MGKGKTNGWFSNILLGIITWVSMVLGFISVVESISTGFNLKLTDSNYFILIIGIISLIISILVVFMVLAYKRKREKVLFVKDFIKV